MANRKQNTEVDLTHVRGQDVAAVMGLTPARVSQFQNEGCPRNDDGTYDIGAVLRWYEHEILKRCTCSQCGQSYRQKR